MPDNVKQFKRIGAPQDELAPPQQGDDMGIVLGTTIAAKLETKRRKLTQELGFELTTESCIGYLLRDVVPALTNEDMIAASMEGAKRERMDRDAEAFMRAGQKINAIKHVRQESSMGLKEAKDYVEHKWQHLVGVSA